MLVKLCQKELESGHQVFVVSLAGPGAHEEHLKRIGVSVFARRLSLLNLFVNLKALKLFVKDANPDILQGWMYHGNLVSLIVSSLNWVRSPVIWNIRHSVSDVRFEKLALRVLIWLGSKLSRYPNGIIYNSQTAMEQHHALGYSSRQSKMIGNGFDVQKFKPDLALRYKLRQELDIPDSAVVIGSIARMHPMKGHSVLVKAHSLACEKHDDLYLVVYGAGVTSETVGCSGIVNSRVHFMGSTQEPELVYPAFDVFISASLWGEGFPNVIGEAMSCGVPCIVTDVGDSAFIVGSLGVVLAPGDLEGLTAAIEKVTISDPVLSEACRDRIARDYSIDAIAELYSTYYLETLG
tara:strand:- start:26792 stop:27841 length:1050 start_codon:yes stop_codon:yes gene_type:complete